MAASFTDVLIVLSTRPTSEVMVPAEKAGKRMSDSRDRWAVIENCRAASDARRAGFAGNSRVIDLMAQEGAFG